VPLDRRSPKLPILLPLRPLYDREVQVQGAGVLCSWEAGAIPALSRSGEGNERHWVFNDHALPPEEVGSDAQ